MADEHFERLIEGIMEDHLETGEDFGYMMMVYDNDKLVEAVNGSHDRVLCYTRGQNGNYTQNEMETFKPEEFKYDEDEYYEDDYEEEGYYFCTNLRRWCR